MTRILGLTNHSRRGTANMSEPKPSWSGEERRRGYTILTTRMDVIHNDVTDIKSALKELTAAITKLALIEERQTKTAQSLDKMEARISRLEHQIPIYTATAKWVDRGVVALVAGAVVFIAKKVGLM